MVSGCVSLASALRSSGCVCCLEVYGFGISCRLKVYNLGLSFQMSGQLVQGIELTAWFQIAR